MPLRLWCGWAFSCCCHCGQHPPCPNKHCSRDHSTLAWMAACNHVTLELCHSSSPHYTADHGPPPPPNSTPGRESSPSAALYCLRTEPYVQYEPRSVEADKRPCMLCIFPSRPILDGVSSFHHLAHNQIAFLTSSFWLFQAAQPLIQWIGNLTLYLLSSLTTFQHYSNFPGSSIISDGAALSKLREMLALIRIWSLINPNCLPHFNTTSAQFDCLATVFKLVTRVWITRKNEGSGADLEESLLDECCLLPNHVLIPPVNDSLFGDTRYECSVFFQSHPVTYTFGEVPGHAVKKYSNGTDLPPGQSLSQQKTDVIRQVTLGTDPVQSVKQCTRCGCVSLLSGLTKASALKAWDMRWVRSCVCGGHWKLANVESQA